MRSLLTRFFSIILLAAGMMSLVPMPASAANVMFSCWCQDESTRTCNHHRIDSGIEDTDAAWTVAGLPLSVVPGVGPVVTAAQTVESLLAQPALSARRAEISQRCIDRCREDSNRRAIHFETTYREEICEECNADPNSSCTEERGARLAFGDAQTEQLIAACEERRSQSLLPLTLAVPIGGVTQVAGLPDYINVAYRYLVTVVLVVAIVMVVYGGFRYLVGASIGDIQAGKKIIVDAIVGMLIVLGAYTILSTVNPATTLLSFDPPEPIECRDLELPEAIKNARCTTDSQCGPGRRCVTGVNYVFSVERVAETAEAGAERGRELGSFIGEDRGFVGNLITGGLIWALIPSDARQAVSETAGEVIGGSVGRDLGIAAEVVQDVRNVRVCSTGEKGSPCLENVHCDARYGSCINSWHICWTTSGNQPGEPCDTDAQCSNGSCVDVSGTDFKVCEIEVRDSTPCFRPNNGQSSSIFPIACNGPPMDTEFVCVWCPSGREGEERVWTSLRPGEAFPAQCKPRSVLTTPTPCAR